MSGKTKWAVPSADDVTVLMSSIVQGAVTKDAAGSVRAQKCLNFSVEQVLGGIRAGGRTPLSLTPHAVPPSGHVHTVVLAVSLMVSSTPNMTFAVKDEFGTQVKDAKEWLKAVTKGELAPEWPVNVDQTTLPAGCTPGHGGDDAVDLSTDGSSAMTYQPPWTPQAVAPQYLQAVGGLGLVALTWVLPPNPAVCPVQFNVYRGDASGTETLLAAGVVGTTYADGNVTSGQAYFYWVTAVNAAGESIPSNEVSATPS